MALANPVSPNSTLDNVNARNVNERVHRYHIADMFHALGRLIFKRQFWQNMMIYGTSDYRA